MTTDPVAIGHILANSQKYYKPEAARWHLSHILGHGNIPKLHSAPFTKEIILPLFTGLVTAEGECVDRLSDGHSRFTILS